MSNSKDDLAQTQTHGENIKYLFLAQRSRPYRGQEYMWYIVPRWYTHVLNIVWLSQRIKKQWPEHSAMSKPLFIWPWCQRSTSYKDNEWMQHDDTHMCQKLLVRSKTCQKPNKFDLEDTCQRRIGILNVRNISLRGDTPICQIWYGNVKAKKKNVTSRTRRHVKTLIILTLRSKVNVMSGSRMFATRRLMVIHPYDVNSLLYILNL